MRAALLAIGVLLMIVGTVWTGQGLGYISGSVMAGVVIWTILGPIVVAAGLTSAVLSLHLSLRRRSRR